jgi:TP901 family phage tail tape measure protein
LADVNSNININFNTAAALAQLRSLQAGLSKFHQSLAEGNLAAANAQKGLNAQLLQSIGATGKFSASQVKVASSTLAFTSALEKNKLSLREYYRYTMAAATANTRVMGKAFAQEREIINRARRDRVKALQAQYIQMNKSNAGFMDAIRIMPKSLQMASGKFTELGTRIQYAAQRQQFLNQLLKQGSTQLLNFGKNTQWAGRQLMVGLTMPLALFGGAAAKTFRELEAEIVKFRRVYGDAFTNDAETDAAVENIRKLASEYTKYGVSVTKTVEMAATAAAAGFSGSALNAQVETATKLAVLGQIEQQQALETTISLQSAFGISSEELAKKIDFLNAVENQTLLSIEDLTIAIPKAAPVVKQLGGSVEDLAFFLTAMKEGGINASEGANALKSGLASLINPAEKSAKFLATLGININGIVEANKGDIKSTVVGFAEALDTLDPLNRARAIEQLFGKFQFSRLSTLFQNVTKDGSQASRAFDLAGKSVEELAILSEREMKKIEDSVGVKFQAAVEQFKQDIMPLGKIFLEALTPVVQFFGSLFEKFNGLSDNTKKVIAIIVGAVAGLGPVVLMTFGLLMNGIANVIKFFAMLRGGIAKLNGQTSVMGAGFNYMTQEQIENAASSQQLHQTHTRLIEVFNVEKTSVNALASSYNSLNTQMRSMAAANPSLFAGGAPGAARAVSKLPPVRKYKDGILSVPGPKGAGDVVPAMLSPGEAVIPTSTTDKYRGLISAMFQDKVPGFMAGRLPGGPGRGLPLSAGPEAVRKAQQATYRRRDDARQGYSKDHPEKKSGPTFIGMPKTAAEASQSRQILDKISNSVKAGRFADVPPTNFGTMLESFSGRSFPARGVGGVYRKPNGQIVVVKPTIDDKTALAEVRATQIAREVHGLVAPKQSIKTMMDPTDPTGQRKFIVIESPYDPRIASMSGKFSKSDMVKQLVASTLRGDKDLQQPNLSGNVLADVGTAGVFDRASGFRDFSKAMPSMEQQAVVNLLGVKGGARKFFAQETSGLAAKMSPAEYDAAIKGEINRSIPRLEKVINSWKDLTPDESVVYNNMLERLKAGSRTEWDKLQPIHARAGQGVVKAEDGIDSGASDSVVEKQIKKYSLSSVEDDQLKRNDLKTSAENAFTARIKELNDSPEGTITGGTTAQERARIVKAAWEGGVVPVPPSGNDKSFTARQTKFINEIQRMTPINVDGVTKYLHPKDMDSFMSDPDGRAKYARTKEQVISNLLYRMGATPDIDGRFVAGGKFEGSRFASAPAFGKSLASTGKQSGGGVGNTSKVVRPFAKEEIDAYNKRVGDPLKTKTGRQMLADGYSADEVRDLLRENLSHIKQEVTGSTSGAKKMKTGEALYDARILNNYMNAKDRSSNILNELNKDYAIVSQSEEPEFRKAAQFMAKGEHPKNAQERALLAKAVELDQRVLNYQDRGNSVSKKYLPADIRTPKILNTLFSDPAFQPGKLMNLAAKSADEVFVGVKRGESLFNEDLTKEEKINSSNSSPMKKDTVAVNKKGKRTKDKAVVKKRQGQFVATAAQASRLRVLAGYEDGTALTPYQRQELKKISTKYPAMSESQLQDTLRRKLKADQDLLKSKEKEAAAARKAAKRAELLPKEEAARQAKENTRQANLAKIENQRQSRILEASRYQDEANKMNEKMDKKQASQKARQMRQQKIGVGSGGAAMALGTAGMGLMMAGQQTAGMAAMGASAVAGMAPMLAGMGPIGWTITAATALGASFYLLDKKVNAAAVKQAEYVRSISATTEKMQKIGEITGEVGSSEIMSRRREGGLFQTYNESERKSSDFGQKFLTSEVGKSIQDAFSSNMVKKGSRQAAEDLSFELSQYISDGIMTAEDAKSIAYQIGVNLKDATLTTNIQGNLRMLVGPNGENLINEPLQARMRIVSMADSRSQRTIQEMFDSKASGNSGAAEAAQLASYSTNTIQVAQAQADAIAVYAEKQKKILEAELLSTKNKERQVEIQKEINGLVNMQITANAKIASAIATAVSNFNVATAGGRGTQGAFFDASKADVKAKYEGTEFAPAAQRVLDKAARFDEGGMGTNVFDSMAKGQALEAKVQFIMASGVMNPSQIEAMLKIFEGDLKSMDVALTVGLRKQGGERMGELTSLLTGVDEEVSKRIMLSLIRKNPEDFEKNAETLALLRASDGYEVNMSAYLKTDGIERLEKLTQKLDAIEQIKDPIVKVTDLQNVGLTSDQLAQLSSDWEYFLKLDPATRKEAIQTFTMITDAIMNFDSPEARAEWARKYASQEALLAGDVGSKEYTTKYNEIYNVSVTGDTALLASLLTQTKYGTPSAVLPKTPVETKDPFDGKKENPLSFLDSLAMRLKQVRDNSFNALKPVESLLAAFTNKETQKGAFKLFDGIQNRLLKMGVGKDLRDAVASMSAEDFSKVANLKGDKALFKFQDGKPKTKANITGLTKTGKSVDRGYREASLGEFNFVNEETVKNIQDQDKAYRMLIGSGLTASQALEVVADESQAAALAAGAIKTSDPEWKKYVANIKQANNALERQSVLNRAIRANEEFKMYEEMPKLVSQMNELGYSTDQIDAVLGDPQLAKFLVEDLKDGKLDAKAIADYLNNIEARKIIDIQVKLNQGDLAGAAAQGRDIVDDLFAAQEGLIRTGSEARQVKANERQIRDLESQIAPFQRQIQLLNDQIEDGQRAIEETYTRPIEDLNEEVSDLNRQLETNPFFGDRAIKKIQDEGSILSNDLEIINNAAEKINEKYDEQAEALSKVQEINQNILEQQKQQLGLADALTQGDISAAARAAQDIRATSASQFAVGQSEALEKARKNAIEGLVGPQSGLTSEQIAEKQFQNSQKIYQMETDPRRVEILSQIEIKQDAIYNLEEEREAVLRKIRDLEDEVYRIEEKSIEPLQERIDALNYTNRLLQDSIDKQIENVRVLGKSRDEWDAINAKLDYYAATKKAIENSEALAGLLSAADALNLTWADILAKMAAYAKGVPGSVATAKAEIAAGLSGATSSAIENATTTSEGAKSDSAATAASKKAAADAAAKVIPSVLASKESGAIGAASIAAQLAAATKAKAEEDRLAALAKQNAQNAAKAEGLAKRYGGYALSSGGIVPKYFAVGGYARGTDTVPAMLTPGEFVMSRYAVQSHGIDKMQAMNNGSSVGDSVYNYSISVNVKSDANPDDIARVVMTQIRNVDSQKLRGARF